ncbi:MAG: SDR family oxidoreductase [Candidatus Dormibacteraeota bacterium]|nr:SDR family oxidoreductase [Candidatus Dormibacteraeota bacterium]
MATELDRFSLAGRVALVPGGAGGIGRRVCTAFSRLGAHVALVSRSATHGAEARDAIRNDAKGPSDVLPIAGDVTRPEDAQAAVEQTVKAFGRLDILVNAVGGGAGSALFRAEDYPESEWDRIVNLNLKSALFPSQAAARAMIASGRGGRILNISSVRGQLGINAGYSAYVAAKGGLNALTRQHATEWAQHQITVNAISPTFVRTPQVESLLADEAFRLNLIKRIPLGRIAEVDDLIGAVIFFCSEAGSFVTGQVLTLDGGLTATQ